MSYPYPIHNASVLPVETNSSSSLSSREDGSQTRRKGGKGRSAALFQILSQKISKIKSPEVQLHTARDHNVEKVMKLANSRKKKDKSLLASSTPQHGNMIVLDDFDKPVNPNVDTQVKNVTNSISTLKISGDHQQPLDVEQLDFYSLDENKELMSLDMDLLSDNNNNKEIKNDRCMAPNAISMNNSIHYSSSTTSSSSTSNNGIPIIPELSGTYFSNQPQHITPILIKPGKGRKLSDVEDRDGIKSQKLRIGSKDSAFSSVPSRKKLKKKK